MINRIPAALLVLTALALLVPASHAQWNPPGGDWSKSDADDVRVMTWNVSDNVSSAANKAAGLTSWEASARIVATLRPDVLLLQEAGDTGTGVDSVADLLTTIDLWLHGGFDPFNGGAAVGAYVQLYAAGYDLPHVYVSTAQDGFNRNVILSRHPFADLNGDGKSQLPDTALIIPDQYAPGGTGGIRGFQHVEIDLPGGTYAGDLVVGNSHLKSGGSASDISARLNASKNIAYYIDAIYNGMGTGSPDPTGKVLDNPAATSILDANTFVVLGGDWNEDEGSNGTKGPADWITMADDSDGMGGTDGTDKDGSDMLYDDAADPFGGIKDTQSSSKLDYIAWQNSVAALRREFLFISAQIPGGSHPAETAGFPGGGALVSGVASDHRPVIVDLIAPLAGVGPASLVINEVDADQTSTDAAEFIELYNPGGAASLDDHFLVLYNGNSAGDAEYNTFDLSGQSVPSDGFFVVGPSTATVPNTDFSPGNFPATNAVQNGADGVALWEDTTGLLTSSDFAGTSPGSPPAGAVLVDALVYDTSDSDDAALIAALTPGQPQVNENGNGAKDTESLSRIPDGGVPLVTTSYITQAPTPGGFNGTPPANPWTDLGFALAGVSGDPLLSGTGTLLPSSSNSVDMTNAAPSALCVFFLSAVATPVPFKGGMLVPIPILFSITLFTDPTGGVALPFSWPATGANPGTIVMQYGIQDAAAIVGVSLSNALQGDAP